MKLRAGMYGKTRAGEKVGPLFRQSRGWAEDKRLVSFDWYDDGFCRRDRIPTPRDIVSEWAEEPKVGEWIGWNGGECPVHPKTIVETCTISGVWNGHKDKAKIRNWGNKDIVAYRVIREYVAAEVWIYAPNSAERYLCKSEKDAQDRVAMFGGHYFKAVEVTNG